jgi:hypothetical protein
MIVLVLVFGAAGVTFVADFFAADPSSTSVLIFLPAGVLAAGGVGVVFALDWIVRMFLRR